MPLKLATSIKGGRYKQSLSLGLNAHETKTSKPKILGHPPALPTPTGLHTHLPRISTPFHTPLNIIETVQNSSVPILRTCKPMLVCCDDIVFD